MNAKSLYLLVKRTPVIGVFLATVAKCILDSRYWYYYFQRFITSIRLRKMMARLETAFTRKSQSVIPDVVLAEKAEELKSAIVTNGVTESIFIADESTIGEIRKFLQNKKVLDPMRAEKGYFSPNEPPAGSHVGYFKGEDVAKAPHVLELANHPLLLQTVENVFKCKPRLDYVGAWWSFPGNEKPEEQQFFHRDIDTLQFIKFFLYLTDVTQDSGPHVYVERSHDVQWRVKSGIRIPDADVRGYFGGENIKVITGKAGTGFLEDTFGIHKGELPKNEPRLLMQFIYAVKRTPFFRPNKAFISKGDLTPGENVRLDPYVNKYFLKPDFFRS